MLKKFFVYVVVFVVSLPVLGFSASEQAQKAMGMLKSTDTRVRRQGAS
jgi:hypothetical protein